MSRDSQLVMTSPDTAFRSLCQQSTVASLTELTTAIAQDSPRGLLPIGHGSSDSDVADNAGGTLIALSDRLADPAVEWIDWEHSVARVSAGASIRAVCEQLLANGWIPAIVPANEAGTVGGWLATDDAGIFARRSGSIADCTTAIELVTSDGSIHRLEPDHASFRATIGGLGLTGIIVAAEIRIAPVQTAWMLVDTTVHDSVDQLLEQIERHPSSTHGWIVTSDKREQRILGRQISWARVDDLPPNRQTEARTMPPAQPTAHPGRLRRLTTNTPAARVDELLPCATALFHPPTSEPDDSNRLRYRCALPDTQRATVLAIIEQLTTACADTNAQLRVHAGSGDTHAMLGTSHLGWHIDCRGLYPRSATGEALAAVDDLVQSANGRITLGDDARVLPDVVREMFDEFDDWIQLRQRLDPDARLQSNAGRRLGLLGGDSW